MSFEVVLVVGGIVAFLFAVKFVKAALSNGIDRVFDAGVKVVNQQKNARVDRVMTKPTLLETRATVGEIRDAVTAALTPKAELPFVGVGLVEISRTDNRLCYAMGNRFFPREMLAEIEIVDQVDTRRVVFTCTHLAERNGIRPLADGLLLMEQTIVHAVGAAGVPAKVAAVARAYGPPDPGTPLASRMAVAKGMIAAGAVAVIVVVIQLGLGVLVRDVPFWLLALAVGSVCSWLGSRLYAQARDQHISAVLSARQASPWGNSALPPTVASSEVPPAAPVLGSHPKPNPAARLWTSIDGRARVLIVAATVMLLLAIGVSAMNARNASVLDEGSSAEVSESASDYATDGSEGDGESDTQDTAEAESPPADMAPLEELLAQAPSDGSVVTRRAFWDAENSVSEQRIAFTTDDPAHEGQTYMIAAEQLTSCYVSNRPASADDLIAQAFGMYHAGTITYSKEGLVDVRAIAFKASEIDSDMRDGLVAAACQADAYTGEYTMIDLKWSDDWALGVLQQDGGQQYLDYYAWHRAGGVWRCQKVGSPTSDYREASMQLAAKAGVPQELISELQWQFKPSWREGE